MSDFVNPTLGSPPEGYDFETPPDRAKLWRYISLPQLVDLLHSQSLYLACLTHLDDWCEGSLPPMTVRGLEEFYRMLPEGGEKRPTVNQFLAGFNKVGREWLYVSCWCELEHESDALWRLYARDHGVALRTRASLLAPHLPKGVCMGRVKYDNYESAFVQPGNLFNQGMWKRHQYEFEHEVRLITIRSPDQLASMPPRVALPVDKAIEAIVITPYAKDWFAETVRAVVAKFGSALPVTQSSMKRQPGRSFECTSTPPPHPAGTD